MILHRLRNDFDLATVTVVGAVGLVGSDESDLQRRARFGDERKEVADRGGVDGGPTAVLPVVRRLIDRAAAPCGGG